MILGGQKLMIFDGWKFPNEAVDKNDFETSELYKKNGPQ